MFCNKCGSQINQNTKFCEKCGNNVQTIVQNPNIGVNPTPQNFNQNVPSQYPINPNTNKSNKTALYVLLGVGVIVALLIIKVVSSNYIFTNVDDMKDKIQDELDKTDTNDKDDEVIPVGGTKRVGSDVFGYVSVPNEWNKFIDLETEGTYQYSSNDGYVVTLLSYEDSDGKSKTYSTNIYNNMEEGGATGVTGAKVKMGNFDAYQVYGFYPDQKLFLVTWMFEPGDGKTHYISVEGPDRYSDNYDIPNTFALDK